MRKKQINHNNKKKNNPVIHWIFVLCIVGCLLLTNRMTEQSILHAQGKTRIAFEYYENARELYQQGQNLQALDALKEALTLDKNLTDAYDLRAQILLERDTEYDWSQSQKAVQKAIEIQPENGAYRFTLGRIFEKQGSRYNAANLFEQAIKRDPANVEAYYHLGTLYHTEMYYYKGKVDVQSMAQLYDENMLRYQREHYSMDGRWDTYLYTAERQLLSGDLVMNSIYGRIIEERMNIGVISFDKYADEALERAQDYLTRGLKIDPNHWQSILQLGLLAYETNNLEALREHTERLEQLQVDHKDAHLFLGIAYHKQRLFDLAEGEFQKALTYLSVEEKRIFQSPQYILSANGPDALDSEEIIKKASAIDNNIFWKSKDPFFLTEENERKLAHLVRCAYSHFRFSYPLRDIEGLLTDRGKTYVRYGNPLYISRTSTFEIWYYEERTFCFYDQWGDGRTGFRIGGFYFANMREAARIEFQQHPEAYDYESEGEVFHIPCQVVSFRGSPGKTALEILYGLPVVQEDFQPVQGIHLASYNTGIFLFDNTWKDILKQRSQKQFTSETPVDTNRTDLMTDVTRLEIEPGTYHFSFELENAFSKNESISRDTLKVSSYEGNDLMLSDILLAMNVQPLKEPLQKRDDLQIFANPTSVYHPDQLLHLYCEIYNLAKGRTDGRTRFSISTSVSSWTPPKEGLDRIFSNVKDLLGFRTKEAAVTYYYEYEGITETELYRSILDMKELNDGNYILTLDVKDMISGQETSKSVAFQVRTP